MDEDKVVASKGSSKDDPYQVNNLIHNIPMYEERGVAPGLAVLTEAMPLVEPSKMLTMYSIF